MFLAISEYFTNWGILAGYSDVISLSGRYLVALRADDLTKISSQNFTKVVIFGVKYDTYPTTESVARLRYDEIE